MGKGIKTGRLWVYLGDLDNPFIVYDYTTGPQRRRPRAVLEGLTDRAISSPTPIPATTGSTREGSTRSAAGRTRGGSSTTPGAATRSGRTPRSPGSADSTASRAKPGSISSTPPDLARPPPGTIAADPGIVGDLAGRRGIEAKVLPRSPIGEAISYSRSNWAALSRYLEAEYLSIDNNASENAIRPIALGRKNWLFCGSDRGGQTAATLMSLTCVAASRWGSSPSPIFAMFSIG